MQAVTITQITPPELEALIDNIVKKALASNNPVTNTQPSDKWMDLTELCSYIPGNPAKPTIFARMSEIPHHKKGKQLYFLKSEIDEWLKTGRKKVRQK